MRVLKTDSWLDAKSLRFGCQKGKLDFWPFVFPSWGPAVVLPWFMQRNLGAILIPTEFLEQPNSFNAEALDSLFGKHLYCIGVCRKERGYYLLLGASPKFDPVYNYPFHSNDFNRIELGTVFPEHIAEAIVRQESFIREIDYEFTARSQGENSWYHSPLEQIDGDVVEFERVVGSGRMDAEAILPTVEYSRQLLGPMSKYCDVIVEGIKRMLYGSASHISIEKDLRRQQLLISTCVRLPFCDTDNQLIVNNEISYERLEDGAFDALCAALIDSISCNIVEHIVDDVLYSFITNHQGTDLIAFRGSEESYTPTPTGTERLVTTRASRVLKL